MTSYLRELASIFQQIECHADALPISGVKAIEMASYAISQLGKTDRKMILVGNGGSAAIASHVATDAIKNAGIRALVFTDPSLLTCLSNDRGYPEVYATPIKLFAQPGDVLIAISSSGNSENILRAVDEAIDADMIVITLSGFDRGNRLRKVGSLSFYVPAHAYGMVEVTHMAILHGVIDAVITQRA